jgi:hypothetical protein
MNQHEWIPSENDTRRHCKYCGIYEDYTNKYPECEPQEKPVLDEVRNDMPWEVVYEKEDYGGGYGFMKVGVKTPDCHIIWLASYGNSCDGDRFIYMEKCAKEICRHMNSLEGGPDDAK